MQERDFSWLNDVDKDESAALAKVVSIFLRGMTPEDLASLETEDET